MIPALRSRLLSVKANARVDESGALTFPAHRLILLAAATAVVVYLSVMPQPPDPGWRVPHLDKIVHWSEFWLLSALALYAFSGFSPGGRVFGIRSGLSAVYGIFWSFTTEGMQFFAAGRTPSWADTAADLAGVAAGVIFARRYLNRRSHAPPA